MLRTPADFPHAGSFAFLAPAGEKVRILRRNADATVLVEFVPDGFGQLRNRDASGNRQVRLADLAATRAEVLPVSRPAAAPSARVAAKPAAKPAPKPAHARNRSSSARRHGVRTRKPVA